MMKRYRMKVLHFTLPVIVGLMLFTTAMVAESHYKVIKNPVPTMKVKNFVKLEKVGEIADEVAKNIFLFLPCSMAMDDQKNLLVYDVMQAKILVFDSSFNYVSSFGGKWDRREA